MKTSSVAHLVLVVGLTLAAAASGGAQDFEVARIYIEYNQTANDLGFHVVLDGEEWTDVKIYAPDGRKIFEVSGKGGYQELGLTELFFEGAEPTLDEVPLEELLSLFPEGEYRFVGKNVDNEPLDGTAVLEHVVPAGPDASTQSANGTIRIDWTLVTGPAAILPGRPVTIVGYQVIAGSFQVTLPASSVSVTLPPEYYQTLESGAHDFEVLAIDESGNQTITEGTFEVP